MGSVLCALWNVASRLASLVVHDPTETRKGIHSCFSSHNVIINFHG